VKILEEWLAEEPADPVALHMLAACTGRHVPPRASNGFVERTFDSFAASFESKLEALSYRAPALVAAMVEDSGLDRSKRLDVLLVFTLEHAAGGSIDAGYRLELHGRYSHVRAYVEQLLVRCGLRPEVFHADLRMEAGRPVAGLVVRATKLLP
jgi:predicted TPR repeat methyltransferase